MLPVKKIIVLSILSITIIAARAQPPKTSNKGNAAQKIKPKLTSTIGGYKDSSKVTADIALNLIDKPVIVSDDKKSVYTISTYQFLYRRKGVIENEETGKVTPTSTVVASQFKKTPLSAIWINTIKEQLQPGEELFFFDIVVKDAQGKLMFAPNIKILVQ